jgi:hypothetical protein
MTDHAGRTPCRRISSSRPRTAGISPRRSVSEEAEPAEAIRPVGIELDLRPVVDVAVGQADLACAFVAALNNPGNVVG